MFRFRILVTVLGVSFSSFVQASFAPQGSRIFDTTRFEKENRTKQEKAADAFAKSILREYRKCLDDAGKNNSFEQICKERISHFAVITQKNRKIIIFKKIDYVKKIKFSFAINYDWMFSSDSIIGSNWSRPITSTISSDSRTGW
jgi:uncharacterized FlgJ-related protein